MTEIGDNSAITPEEKRALFFQHFRRIKAAKTELDAARADYKELRAVAKADGITMRQMDHALKHVEADDEKIIVDEIREIMEVAEWFAAPINTQFDIFTDRAPVEQKIREAGVVAGLSGNDGVSGYAEGSPDDKLWMEGWHAGQAKLAEGIKSVNTKQTLAAKQATEDPDETFPDLDPEDAEGMTFDPEDIDFPEPPEPVA